MYEPEILTERKGAVGIIALNRPRALNALSPDMLRIMQDTLQAWALDDAVCAVVIKSAVPCMFCAGGDIVRAVKAVAAGEMAAIEAYFHAEYRLDYTVARFPKPVLAFMDGVVMGGGAGISVHGAIRIATENTLFAMPEVHIGLFPDVGAGYFLNRCPGQTGLYLALTGARIRAADMLDVGLATHFMPAGALAALEEALQQAPWGAYPPLEAAERAIAPLLDCAGDAALAAEYEVIERCFAPADIEGVINALRREEGAFAEQTLEALERACPTSLKVTFRHIRASRALSPAEVLNMDCRLSLFCLARGDFREGVRAAVIDKDRNPKWSPARLQAVSPCELQDAFTFVPDNPLNLQ